MFTPNSPPSITTPFSEAQEHVSAIFKLLNETSAVLAVTKSRAEPSRQGFLFGFTSGREGNWPLRRPDTVFVLPTLLLAFLWSIASLHLRELVTPPCQSFGKRD
ncbi:hypothetical protein BaRGS_00032970 [Batillaria attramentaria]|uniref:Uncharacterized protein n=1 Tax=Batillaria attramentaria TaxID=370345 RepID=A0ABD0JLV7_9CAEN